MKIVINVDETLPTTEIAISCSALSPEIEKIISALRILDRRLTVKKNDTTYLLDVTTVIYIEAIDRKTFIYTIDEVYESSFKLYELEVQLEEMGFFRISKNCIIQLKKIKSLKADIDRRIRLTLDSGEQIIASRQYADQLKKRLGVK